MLCTERLKHLFRYDCGLTGVRLGKGGGYEGCRKVIRCACSIWVDR